MIRRVVFVTFFIFIAAHAFAQAPKPVEIRKSLVRITATSQEPDYKVPWNPGAMSVGVGAGFVIDGDRIMTNAHVVSNARFIVVEKEDDPQHYPAMVQFVGHDCDLAVLRVLDKGFFQNTRPLSTGGIPAIESPVSVYGYPIGGERLSVTRGIISRIDFQTYTHSGIDSHLAVQIDAAINPGKLRRPGDAGWESSGGGIPRVQWRRGPECRLHDPHPRYSAVPQRYLKRALRWLRGPVAHLL